MLTDNSLVSLIKYRKIKRDISIEGFLTNYRNYFFQKKTGINVGISPVAVSGLLYVRDSVDRKYLLFAKRSNKVTSYPGYYELVPSGSLDSNDLTKDGSINFKNKLLLELEEEAGISKQFVKKIQEFALVEDVNDQVLDICCQIEVHLKKRTVLKKMAQSIEYQYPVFVLENQIENFVLKNRSLIVPTSLAILNAKGIFKK